MMDNNFYIEDFTVENYARLLALAKKSYKFIDYSEIDLNEKFILWRHDCDYSLNRSLRLAHLEKDAGVKATYFLNPHCDFYNVLEKKQSAIIQEILSLGHKVGLHFDAAFYDVYSESQLHDLILQEAKWINEWFDVDINVFSFHNPTDFLLTCEQEEYGGLINCYSSLFKKNISYCSDSNGHWRFRRLEDILKDATAPCLQVLTHPGWWQEEPMSPRDRIFRCVQGRAAAVMKDYDDYLFQNGRKNIR